MRRTVLVTGMGGNVGQGIVRSIRDLAGGLRIVGTSTDAISAGTHLCDRFHPVPPAVDPAYCPTMKALCASEGVELIIPSTDHETYHLSRAQAELPTVAVSPPDTCAIFLDKLRTAEVFAIGGVPFARSTLPRDYDGSFAKVIVKPRQGRGSRGIYLDPVHPEAFSDEYMVQERHAGVEITTAFYVRKDGSLHGHVTMERSLTAGMTSSCEVTFVHDRAVVPVIRSIVAALPVRGSCNVQSIVTARGEVIPFEVNGRLSGTTSIRGQLGFPDARWTVQEYLLGGTLAPPAVIRGAAVRMAVDIVYPGATLNDVADPHSQHFLF